MVSKNEELIIDISYNQVFDNNKNTKEIIESFGLTTDKKRTIVEGLKLSISPHSVYYICGYSGSGKSSILNSIHFHLQKLNKNVLYIKKWSDVKFEPEDAPLIEYFPDIKSNDKLKMLSKCGLGEAWKFISRYSQLSDGEKFRFCLYHSIMSLAGQEEAYILFDEFCSTLDRITAKAVAVNIHKIAKQTGITFILASAHDDLIDHIQADYTLFKEFDEHVEVITGQ